MINDSTKAPVTLLDCVSAADTERLEAMHARIMTLSTAENVGDAAREMTGWFYDIMKMPVIHHEAVTDRLNVQHSRIFQTVSIVKTALIALNAIDEDADDDLTALYGSLSHVNETLTDIAAQIEPPVMLAREVANG